MKWTLLLLFFATTPLASPPSQLSQAKPMVELRADPAQKQVEVLVDGELFTAYIYPDMLKKPVLWPVMTPGGNAVTRSFPLAKKAGERVDHPHHVGVWFNYGDVNGLDFWNNSEAIPAAKADGYGSIVHQAILKTQSGKGKATLETTALWQDHSGKTLLDEQTQFVFRAEQNVRIIDRTTTLKAQDQQVTFTDNKEGMFGLRVARELEMPEDKPQQLSDAQGNVTKVDAPDNTRLSGNYLSSEGITGGDVWGTRATWMKLYGELNGEKVALVIYDNPKNVGYPTYWHARTYGLFAANTLGQKVFSKGENELNYRLEAGASVTFRYRLAVFAGEPSVAEVEAYVP